MNALRTGAVAAMAAGLMTLAKWLGPLSHGHLAQAEPVMTLGFLMIFAFFMGQAAPVLGAPSITGYLLAGIVAGPFVLGLAGKESAEPLRMVNGLALSLIAFNAGGELRIARFKPVVRMLAWIVAGQSTAVFLLVTAVMFPFLYFTSPAGAMDGAGPLTAAAAGALLLGVLSIANSPATAVAVITEGRARGPASDTIMGVTVAVDVVVAIVFALIMPVAGSILGLGGAQASFGVTGHIGGAALIGLAAGGALILALRGSEANAALWVAGMGMAISEVSVHFHASAMLAALIAGFLVENISRAGQRLIEGIETISAPVYVVFFSLAGQGLDLESLGENILLAGALVASRIAAIKVGVSAGAAAAGAPLSLGPGVWPGLVGQAGINIGFALLVAHNFGLLGQRVAAIAIAAVAVNQVAGPVMMRRALRKAGEIATGEPGSGSAARP